MTDSNRPIASHILSYVRTLRGGGVERALLRLVCGWVSEGREVTLVIGDPEGPLANELPPGVRIDVLGSDSYVGLLLRLADRVRRHRPDILFCPGSFYTSSAALTRMRLRGASPPIVAKVSNALDRSDLGAVINWGNRHWQRLHPLFLDHVVAMTRGSATEVIAGMGIAGDRVSVIPNAPSRAAPDANPLPLPGAPFILGLGRLEPQKRWDRLIAALPRLARSDVKLLILGEGSLRGALEAQAAALGIGERLLLPGHCGNPSRATAAAALVALTSDYEGVPAVLREALAVGTPVVSTQSSVAIAEIIQSPELGSIVPLDDATALVAALDHWLAPGRPRPTPVPMPGLTSVTDYLALFDRLVAARAAGARRPELSPLPQPAPLS